MNEAHFAGILILTRVGTHLWKDFCESVATIDVQESSTLDATLETVATAKKVLEWTGKAEERRDRRLRAALIATAKKGVGCKI